VVSFLCSEAIVCFVYIGGIESLFKLSFHNATYTGLKTRCSIFKLLIVYSFALVLLTYSLLFHQYISNVLFIDSIDGVMVSVLASSAVDSGFG
jgi:hypothetical protein